MPVVLPEAAWDRWLDPRPELTTADVNALTDLLVPAPDDWFEAYVVSPRVNQAIDHDSPGATGRRLGAPRLPVVTLLSADEYRDAIRTETDHLVAAAERPLRRHDPIVSGVGRRRACSAIGAARLPLGRSVLEANALVSPHDLAHPPERDARVAWSNPAPPGSWRSRTTGRRPGLDVAPAAPSGSGNAARPTRPQRTAPTPSWPRRAIDAVPRCPASTGIDEWLALLPNRFGAPRSPGPVRPCICTAPMATAMVAPAHALTARGRGDPRQRRCRVRAPRRRILLLAMMRRRSTTTSRSSAIGPSSTASWTRPASKFHPWGQPIPTGDAPGPLLCTCARSPGHCRRARDRRAGDPGHHGLPAPGAHAPGDHRPPAVGGAAPSSRSPPA